MNRKIPEGSGTKPLVLVDGSSYLYRAYHAMPPLTNAKGEPTGVIYGMINMLRRLLADIEPEKIAIVFDLKGKTFRDEIYAHYKIHRPPMPHDLAQQIPAVHTIIQAMGLPLIQIEGIEADDIIATLAIQANTQGIDTLISTSDKDLAQLVNNRITLINTMTQTRLTPTTVKDKFGVMPSQIVDYLSLIGDTVDNIPGVANVGPKTAAKWLQNYGTLDNLILHADEIRGKVGDNLRASITQLSLAKTLITLKTDVDLAVTVSDLQRSLPDNDKLADLFDALGFKTWQTELHKNHSQLAKLPEKYTHYVTLLDKQQFEHWLTLLSQASLIAFDTETTSLNYMDAKLVGVSFAIIPGHAAYVPFGHDYLNVPPQLNANYVLAKLKPILENPLIKKVGHNIKYDLSVLANHAIQLQGIAHDTMLESYILNSGSNKHDMDALAARHLHWPTITYETVAGKGAKQINFSQVAIDAAAIYAAEDADVTLQLHQTLYPQLVKEPKLNSLYQTLEISLIPILASIERNGVRIDPDLLKEQGKALAQRLLELEKEAYQLAGTVFNINSPKQLQEIFFNLLKLPVLQKTPTGQASTADSVLQELAFDFQLPKIIIEYRTINKLMSTYINRLPAQINAATGRIHTHYNQTGTTTGRLSSSEPNLQNIPIRSTEGRRIRQAFIAEPNYRILSADYSQIELRLMAHMSQDTALLNAFARNEDIHRATAAEIFNIPLAQVTATERRSAKAINFGLIYGMSAFGLAKQLKIDRQAAQYYIDRYFQRYPQIKFYMENTRQQAHQQGYVETLWGRRLHLPDINAKQMLRQKAAERTAINAPLQGSAADIIKRAMIAVDQWLQEACIDGKIIMQVHDELVFEIAEDQLETATFAIRQHMMAAASLAVPLLVNIGIGANWDDASNSSVGE